MTLTDWERDLIAQARQLARDGVASAEAQALARELLRQLADLAEALVTENKQAP
jgi:hypothetical protein